MNIKEKLKSKVNIFGKQVSVFMIMFVLMAGCASAALLSSYGNMTGTVTVEQAIELTSTDGATCVDNVCTYDVIGYGGGVYFSPLITVTNMGNNGVPVSFTSTLVGPSPGTNCDVGDLCCVEGDIIGEGIYDISYEGDGFSLHEGDSKYFSSGNTDMNVMVYVNSNACPGEYTIVTTVNAL